ncbi:hypothetical protein AB0J86_06190 [Micromonospora sp. NPDC049559]|uniref:hypothetical protein n=1 Tax=Micromonospora sp. NPDC049559 TaxID=3155923 RepID=UPI0034277D99
MAMMVTARKVDEGPGEIRYAFGLETAFDRVLVIDKRSWEARVEDGRFDAAASAITAKIKKLWRAGGEFPPGATFAS